MKLIILTIVFICIALFEIPRIIKRNQKIELLIFIVLLTMGFFLNLALVIDIKITNPNKIIIKVIEGIKPMFSVIKM